MLDYDIDPDNVHVGPSDYVPWLLDRKWCYIRMEGTTFGDVPLNAEMQARGLGQPQQRRRRDRRHPLPAGWVWTAASRAPSSRPSAYFKKSPPIQIHDDIAFNRVEAFIRGEDNETLVGTETLPKKVKKTAPLRGGKAAVEAK